MSIDFNVTFAIFIVSAPKFNLYIFKSLRIISNSDIFRVAYTFNIILHVSTYIAYKIIHIKWCQLNGVWHSICLHLLCCAASC